jgi:hypothetical protein
MDSSQQNNEENLLEQWLKRRLKPGNNYDKFNEKENAPEKSKT